MYYLENEVTALGNKLVTRQRFVILPCLLPVWTPLSGHHLKLFDEVKYQGGNLYKDTLPSSPQPPLPVFLAPAVNRYISATLLSVPFSQQ